MPERDVRLYCEDILDSGNAISEFVEDLKSKRPEVEWQDIKDFRNLLTHEYFGVDLEIVWRIIEDDLPVLMDSIKEIMPTGGG